MGRKNMKIKIEDNRMHRDFQISNGDLIYNLEHNEFFRVCYDSRGKIGGWLLVNLTDGTCIALNSTLSLFFSEVVELLKSTEESMTSFNCANRKNYDWNYISREDYNITISLN
jgi:hypothetical protein